MNRVLTPVHKNTYYTTSFTTVTQKQPVLLNCYQLFLRISTTKKFSDLHLSCFMNYFLHHSASCHNTLRASFFVTCVIPPPIFTLLLK